MDPPGPVWLGGGWGLAETRPSLCDGGGTEDHGFRGNTASFFPRTGPPGRRVQDTEPNQRLTTWQISKDGESHKAIRRTLRGKLFERVSVCWSLQENDTVIVL